MIAAGFVVKTTRKNIDWNLLNTQDTGDKFEAQNIRVISRLRCVMNALIYLINNNEKKTLVYKLIVLVSIISWTIYIFTNKELTEGYGILELLLMGVGEGFITAITPEWTITTFFIRTMPRKINGKKIRLLKKHPKAIAARREGFSYD